MFKFICGLNTFIGWFGRFVPQLLFRILVAWHFWDSGIKKFKQQVTATPEQNQLPFSLVVNSISLELIMWIELVCAILILIGFGTRYAALGLLAVIGATFLGYMPLDADPAIGLWDSIETQIPEFQFNLALLLILLSLFLSGAGGLGFDGLFRVTSCTNKRRMAIDSIYEAKQAKKDARYAEEQMKKANLRLDEAEAKAKDSEKRAMGLEDKLKTAEARIKEVEGKIDKSQDKKA